ncbi:hypothetical protein A2U01_0048306, partial [Trifolium medium]|nr:hypothetical protein [Trifolium medium]
MHLRLRIRPRISSLFALVVEYPFGKELARLLLAYSFDALLNVTLGRDALDLVYYGVGLFSL